MGDYIGADTIPGHPLSGSGKQIPKGSDQGFTPQSGSDGFYFLDLPTADPNVSGSLWRDGTDLKVSLG